MTSIACDGSGSNTANCGQTLDKWMSALLIRLPGAVSSVVRCELQAAVRDFYHRSLGWRETFGPLNVAANQQYIWLNPVDMYADMQHVLGAYLIISGTRKELQRMTVATPGERTANTPDSFYLTEPYTLELFPTPNLALGKVLYVYGAMTPHLDTERLPEIAASHHFEGILAGALMRLYAIPNKPWTNLPLAAAASSEYRRRIMVAKDEANRGHTSLDTPFRFPKWA